MSCLANLIGKAEIKEAVAQYEDLVAFDSLNIYKESQIYPNNMSINRGRNKSCAR